MPQKYTLICQSCHKEFIDDGFQLECDVGHEPTLLSTQYTLKQFETNKLSEDIYRYQKWLPTSNVLPGAGRTITYQSQRLCHLTGIPNLWIAFNGYWPEKGANLATTTFKDLEAYTVLSRFPSLHDKILVISSAGNTAASFASTCSQNNIPCLIIIPNSGLQRMQFIAPLAPCVKIVTLTGFTDYYDAIMLANRVAQHDGFILEGGVKNVGRRDGLGTTLLSAVETIGQLPDYYFQAVGSGAGGIAVHETAKKLRQDGRFGLSYPQLMLCQNLPFAPMYHAWNAGVSHLIHTDKNEGKKQIEQIAASVLSNQQPPYAVKGGVFDVLKESKGKMLAANNQEVKQAIALFQETENIDIDPAAGVAFAALLQQIKMGLLDKHAYILLNVTGGGWERRRMDYTLLPVRPALEVQEQEQTLNTTVEKIIQLFC